MEYFKGIDGTITAKSPPSARVTLTGDGVTVFKPVVTPAAPANTAANFKRIYFGGTNVSFPVGVEVSV
ncbi:MAG: hypothetical protein GWN18_13825, partial [Thermoplasmata archaeon]|nr:hypothetical protein [Thermoplasmata archaeon]NIW83602.1 hypothetical protein [Thermoplasmata archaeon]NIW89852.1 hypothetical protein [Thermoplasmata archaeon]